MKKFHLLPGVSAGALVLAGLAAIAPGATAASPAGAHANGVVPTVHVCPTATKPGFATCLAVAVAGSNGKPLLSAHPLAGGFTPDMIQAAYSLTGLKSHGATVAIVDADAYPDLESDLTKYRSTYGLPACTTKSGCLTIMNQRGGSTPPKRVVANWQLEQALDVDMVSAACPDCKIVMVEANTGNIKDLAVAVDRAAMQPGVVAISNSYIFSYTVDHHPMTAYDHPGIAITAGTGDAGYKGGGYPADDPHVVGVSGTSLVADGSQRGYNETIWSGTGSGCAEKPENTQPSWQKGIGTTCSTKAVGDVSAAANPGAGGLEIVIHGSFAQVGGTSESTPLIAAVYALSGNTAGYPAKYPYADPGDLYDITSGSNGSCGAPLCTAGKGWDGVSGVGSPDGVAGF